MKQRFAFTALFFDTDYTGFTDFFAEAFMGHVCAWLFFNSLCSLRLPGLYKRV